MSSLTLQTPIDDLFMVGPIYAQRLKKLNIYLIEDLLRHYPFRYDDYSLITKINEVQPGEIVTINGVISKIKNIYAKNGKKIQRGEITDETGSIEVIWYNQPFLINILKIGIKVNLAGKISWFNHKLNLESPEYEILKFPSANKNQLKNIHTGRLVPIYPETAGVSSKWIRSRIAPLLSMLKYKIPEFLPENILARNKFISEIEAISQIHFPESYEKAQDAKRRLSFDELFLIQLQSILQKKSWQNETVGNKFKVTQFKKKISDFIIGLPFNLTASQKRAVDEILADLSKNNPMNRLLEGEVGSGKTVVAAIAMYLTYLNGYQSVLMAPTEILAKQHFETVINLLGAPKIKIALVTRNSKLNSNNTKFDIFIGTHALLSAKLKG